MLAAIIPLHHSEHKSLPVESAALDRSLPAWAIDRIRDGLETRDNRKQYGALVSVCMSAQRRNWGEAELANLVCDPYQSKLWIQLSRNSNGKPYPATNMAKTYAKAWNDAESFLLDPDNSYDMKQRALELAFTWTDLLNDSDLETGLKEPEIAVLRYVIAETERRQWEKVACPSRAVEESTGYGRQRIRTAFAKLTERGVLTQYEKGRGGTTAGKAAIYGLNLESDPWPP